MDARVENDRFWNPASNASFLLGLGGSALGIIPFAGILAVFPGLLAIPFGIAGKTVSREQHGFGRGRARAGIVLGIVAVVLASVQAFGWRGNTSPGAVTSARDAVFAPVRVDPACYSEVVQPICSEMTWFVGSNVNPISYRQLERPSIEEVDGHLRYTTRFVVGHENVSGLADGYEFSFHPPKQFQPPSYRQLRTTRDDRGRTLRFSVRDQERYLLVIQMHQLPRERVMVKATLTTSGKVV